MIKWIPLPGDWVALYKGKDEHDNRHNIDDDAIGNDRHSNPCLGPEEPADQDSDHQLGEGDCHVAPCRGEKSPECGWGDERGFGRVVDNQMCFIDCCLEEGSPGDTDYLERPEP